MFVEAGDGCALGAARLIGIRVLACGTVACPLSQTVSYLIDIMVISYQGIVNRVCCFHKRCVKFWKEFLRKTERNSCRGV